MNNNIKIITAKTPSTKPTLIQTKHYYYINLNKHLARQSKRNSQTFRFTICNKNITASHLTYNLSCPSFPLLPFFSGRIWSFGAISLCEFIQLPQVARIAQISQQTSAMGAKTAGGLLEAGVPRGSFFRSPFFISLNIAMIGHRKKGTRNKIRPWKATHSHHQGLILFLRVWFPGSHHQGPHIIIMFKIFLTCPKSQAAPWAPCPLAWAARCHRWWHRCRRRIPRPWSPNAWRPWSKGPSLGDLYIGDSKRGFMIKLT